MLAMSLRPDLSGLVLLRLRLLTRVWALAWRGPFQVRQAWGSQGPEGAW